MTVTRAFGAVLVLLLLFTLACGAAEEATPTQAPQPTPTATPYIVPPLIIPTATATPTPPKPGVTVTAVPTPTATPTPKPPAGEQPKYGGTINLPLADLHTFDQMGSGSGYGWDGIGRIGPLWGGLLRVNLVDRVTVEGDLAESWSVSQDGTIWKFKIRAGVLDHEGKPFTVEDAYYNMYRYLQKPGGLVITQQTCIGDYVKPLFDKDGKKLPDAGAEITGPDELTVRLKAPSAAFIPCVSSAYLVFMPDTYIKPIDDSGKYRDLNPAKGEVIGTGPFKVKSIVIDTKEVWDRNPTYFRKGLPYLDSVVLTPMLDVATRMANFRAGRLDHIGVFETRLTKRDSDTLAKVMGDQWVVDWVTALGWKGIHLNLTRPPFGPQGDVNADKVRRAIQIAYDRQKENRLIYEDTGILSTPYFFYWGFINTPAGWLKDLPGFDPNPQLRAQWVAEAQKLMKEAGYGPDNPLKFEHVGLTEGKTEFEALIDQLRTIYMEGTIRLVDSATRTPLRRRGEFQSLATSIGVAFPDPDGFDQRVFRDGAVGGSNYGGWVSPKFRELFEKQTVLLTEAERGPILREMAKILHQDAAFIGMVRPTAPQGHRGDWRGWVAPKMHAANYSLENLWLATK